jgi:5-amino-6-(5-phospho-D-ribitylamino)uracil phosphatase
MATAPAPSRRRLVALDVDGTIMHDDGRISPAVVEQIRRIAAGGDEITLATGRPVASVIGVLDRLGITPEYAVCCNGAITIRRDASADGNYSKDSVATYDPTEALHTLRACLPDALYAVEDEHGNFLYTEALPGLAGETGVDPNSRRVRFEELLGGQVTRVVVAAPAENGTEEFFAIMAGLGLDHAAYSIGRASYLDLAPHGVNKATALEHVRRRLGVEPSEVVVFGDGRNDIEMLRWAGAAGHGFALGQAPREVREAASEVLPSIHDDGVAAGLARLDTAEQSAVAGR